MTTSPAPVRALKNQYRGLNAHLHSFWQARGGWPEFHTRHIVYLAEALQAELAPLGYIAAVEPSLQIRRVDDRSTVGRPQPDIALYDPDPVRAARPAVGASPAAGELVLPIMAALRDDAPAEREYRAVAVYRLEDILPNRGQPVAWFELLSPSNKPGGRDAYPYAERRLAVVGAGVVFVELDYLHATPPTLHGLPGYHEMNTHPYRIAIVDPRPDMQTGVLRVREFEVDTPIPTMTIPLSGDDLIRFDFDAPYQRTFEAAGYGLYLVDYAQLPLEFARYRPDDQARIARRMLAVIEAVRAGYDLSAGPLAVRDDLPLEAALAALSSP